MTSAMRSTVTLHVVSSLDGFITKKDNSISWMDSGDVYERGVTDDGAEVMESIGGYKNGYVELSYRRPLSDSQA